MSNKVQVYAPNMQTYAATCKNIRKHVKHMT